MSLIDTPKEIRQGEELNHEKVAAFIRNSLPHVKGELQIKQFPSGYSNLTYLLTIGDHEFILRKPPIGKKAKSAHDMNREYQILKALKPVYPYVPTPLVYSEDISIVGSPFYIMDRIKGIILRTKFPNQLSMSPKDTEQLCHNFVNHFAQLHQLDYHVCGLSAFGKPEGYIKRQVEGWSKRYRDARTDDVPDFENVMEWLNHHMPSETHYPGIIHNDYKFDNLILNPNNPLEIIGVIDWEMATIGDPLMDLGASLAYWINPDDSDEMKLISTLPTTTPGMLRRKEIVSQYEQVSGRPITNFAFYYCYGLFRLAGIAQQIYYRYYHGQTKDERFKLLSFAVQIFEKIAMKVIQTNEF